MDVHTPDDVDTPNGDVAVEPDTAIGDVSTDTSTPPDVTIDPDVTVDPDVTGPRQALGEPCDNDYPCVDEGYCTINDEACGLGFQVSCCLARGALGDACEGYVPASCLGTLGCVDTETANCANGAAYCCTEAGELGQPCHPETGCDAGLGCARNTCVEAGGDGQPCLADATCEAANLTCFRGTCRAHLGACGIGGSCPAGSRCIDYDRRLCFPMGGTFEPCNLDGTCDTENLACQSASYVPGCDPYLGDGCCAPYVPIGGDCQDGRLACEDDAICLREYGTVTCDGSDSCCVPLLDIGGECHGEPYRCLEGLNCVYTYSNAGPCPEGVDYCCVAAGGPDEACRVDGTCVDGYVCLRDICVEGGGPSQPCLSGEQCDSLELACIQDVCRQHVGPCGTNNTCPQDSMCHTDVDLCLATGGLWQGCGEGDVCSAEGTFCGQAYLDYRPRENLCHPNENSCCIPSPCGNAPGACIRWDTRLNHFNLTVTGELFVVSLPPGGSPSCGGIWGTDIYTYDSSIGCAAVHRGLLTFSAGGTVTVRYLGYHETFVGSTRNGVTTMDYSGYQAFEFVVD